MKTHLLILIEKIARCKQLYKTIVLSFFFSSTLSLSTTAQCGGGYSAAQLNWDVMDFLNSTSLGYTGFYPAATFPYNQNFAVGPRNLNFSISTTNVTLNGENATNTAHAGSFSTAGDDVQFTTTAAANRTITMTFDIDVANVRFSMFDVDVNQVVTITATDAAAVAQNIVIANANGGSAIVIAGSGTPIATATGPAVNYINSDNNGSINITIAGPVRTIVLTLGTAAGDIWLGDILACVTGSFPTNYFTAMQPYTGQPTYIIGTSDTNTVSLINVATGAATQIFRDPASTTYINGLGYDHINNILYYVIDFTTTPSTNRALKKYNFNTGVISTVVADIRTIGIPTFSRGVESAGCAFYDGALYFGIEGNGSNGRESMIWRIDFDASGNVTGTRQVWATISQSGGGLHDWGDFAIADTIMVDFNSQAGVSRYTHYNLHTGQVVNTYSGVIPQPRQTGITWNNTIYWVYDSIAVYNNNGTIGARTRITPVGTGDWVGFCGDATGFRPQSDFGDAPATYDPVALSPALHMKDSTLRLGATFDQEFVKTSSVNADADGADEDAIGTVNVLDTATTNYTADITVYNNTGAVATLIGWLDIDGDGLFEASEGVTSPVPSTTSLQTITLGWLGINTPLTNGQTTYLRIRLTSAANGMTTSDATGYYNIGEVEDYLVNVSVVLPVNLLSFTATPVNSKSVKLDWLADNEVKLSGYEIQRSADGINWQNTGFVNAKNRSGQLSYNSWDYAPLSGKSYYRLKMIDIDGGYKYSSVVSVQIKKISVDLTVFPNPVTNNSVIKINASESADVLIKVFNSFGSQLSVQKTRLSAGENSIPLEKEKLAAGMYMLKLETETGFHTVRFVVK